MKYFIILEAVKNRRVDSLFVDLSHKLFGKEMMLLPWLDTMSGSSRSLECHVGICNELLNFLSDAGEHFSDMVTNNSLFPPFADNLDDAFFGHRLLRTNGI